MASVKARCTPAQLAGALAALTVQVESARVEASAVPLPDYPGGPRPSSVLRLSGASQIGLGENVAFYEAEHERFADYVAVWLRARRAGSRFSVGSALSESDGTPYERAALEAALIDLALRQANLSLHDLSGVREAELRFVVSLAASSEPQLYMQRLRDAGYGGEFKIDVDPAWNQRTLEALAHDPSIVIFDFKGRGEAKLAAQLDLLNPSALFEDPPAGFDLRGNAGPIARDASLVQESAVLAARARGEWVNLKAPRMGGPLELLRALEHAPARAYLGGMFEVGVGRSQARQLAALFCATAPNDLAPNLPSAEAGPRSIASPPARIALHRPGFGVLGEPTCE